MGNARHRWMGLAAIVAAGTLAVLVVRPSWWVPSAANLLRATLGFGPTHTLESSLLSSLDRLETWREEGGAVAEPTAAAAAQWPPAPIGTHPDEGSWLPVAPPCGTLGRWPSDAFRATAFRVDPSRPGVDTRAVAMDLRALRVSLVPGSDVGRGTLGVDAEAKHVVAAFNGAFQLDHGQFGMLADGVLYRAPVPGAATLAERSDGQLWLGSFDAVMDVSQWRWFRQNLQLLQDGTLVRDRLTLDADGRTESIGRAPTRRSGYCLRGTTGFYVWTKRGRAVDLGRAMVALGCDAGIHLDMNAFHTGFEFIERADRPEACTERLDARMSDQPEGRFLTTQPRDFFTVSVRP